MRELGVLELHAAFSGQEERASQGRGGGGASSPLLFSCLAHCVTRDIRRPPFGMQMAHAHTHTYTHASGAP